MRTRRTITASLAVAGLALAGGCGSTGGSSGSGGSSGGSGASTRLTVAAAASLQKAFTAYGREFAQAQASFSFAGSDQIAAQIQQGVRPDVFAAANTTLPAMLHAKGLVGPPVVFTANRLVVAVPSGASKVRALADLARPGVTIAIGAPTVPIGSYTRKVLARLPAGERSRILANVRSAEPDVRGVIAKVTQHAVDAGFVYTTDVDATSHQARAIPLPDALQPQVSYAAAVVTGSKNAAQARSFIGGLLHGAGQRALRRAGFLAPAR